MDKSYTKSFLKFSMRVAVFLFLFAAPFIAGAQASSETLDISAILNRITGWLFGLLLTLAVLFIIVAAYMYLTSGGDAEKVKTASKMIWYTVIAIAVAALAKVIVGITQYFIRG